MDRYFIKLDMDSIKILLNGQNKKKCDITSLVRNPMVIYLVRSTTFRQINQILTLVQRNRHTNL